MKLSKSYYSEQPKKRTVRINANSKSFNELSKMFRKNSRHLPFAKKLIAEGIAEAGLEYLKEKTPGNTLKEASEIIPNGDTYYIVQNHMQAPFVEYGTGTEGEKGPINPEKPSDWKFNSGPKVFTAKNGEKYWYVPKGAKVINSKTMSEVTYGKGGLIQGTSAAMQMYSTRKYIRKNRTKIAKEVVRKILEKG